MKVVLFQFHFIIQYLNLVFTSDRCLLLSTLNNPFRHHNQLLYLLIQIFCQHQNSYNAYSARVLKNQHNQRPYLPRDIYSHMRMRHVKCNKCEVAFLRGEKTFKFGWTSETRQHIIMDLFHDYSALDVVISPGNKQTMLANESAIK